MKCRCIPGEDLGTKRTKNNEIGLSWSRSISPIIQGRMKEIEYSMMSRGRTNGFPGLSIVLLFGSGSSPLSPGGSPPSLGEGSNVVLSLKFRGRGGGPTGPH
jgi:hypothetical protein